ncbi:MAG TPA: nuclear transport factor 2 family protein [Acidimicrobiales bacterium]
MSGPADRGAVDDLVARYAHAVDRRDVAAIVDCFTEDAHLELNGGEAVADGRAAIEALFTAAFAGGITGPDGVSTHLLGDVLVELDGDRAGVEIQGVAWLASPERTTVVVRGLRYTDECVRDGGRWRIRHRVHRSLWQAEIPGGPLPGS